ncbi:MAG: hypothetical protein MZV64_48535 [Ignavibacteriales bacterium]|nr:hypothetical protein [Ignavibacteriales bacterium]
MKADLPCMVYPGTQTSGRFAKGLIVDLSTAGRRDPAERAPQTSSRTRCASSSVSRSGTTKSSSRPVRGPCGSRTKSDAPFMGVAFSLAPGRPSGWRCRRTSRARSSTNSKSRAWAETSLGAYAIGGAGLRTCTRSD